MQLPLTRYSAFSRATWLRLLTGAGFDLAGGAALEPARPAPGTRRPRNLFTALRPA